MKEPAHYNEKEIQAIIKDVKETKKTGSGKPNVIMVMSEAFWDPTWMKGVTFSEDPIPYFHQLQKESTNGLMISPVYGGGTVNTEFEALTGMSTSFYPAVPSLMPNMCINRFIH